MEAVLDQARLLSCKAELRQATNVVSARGGFRERDLHGQLDTMDSTKCPVGKGFRLLFGALLEMQPKFLPRKDLWQFGG